MTTPAFFALISEVYDGMIEPFVSRYYLDTILPALLFFVLGWVVIERLTGQRKG